MNIFNNPMPGDMVTLDMRIKEDVRHMLKAMFISGEDKKRILEEALEDAIKNADIRLHIEKHARGAIDDAVREYFTYGEGGTALKKAINEALNEVIPNIFKQEV